MFPNSQRVNRGSHKTEEVRSACPRGLRQQCSAHMLCCCSWLQLVAAMGSQTSSSCMKHAASQVCVARKSCVPNSKPHVFCLLCFQTGSSLVICHMAQLHRFRFPTLFCGMTSRIGCVHDMDRAHISAWWSHVSRCHCRAPCLKHFLILFLTTSRPK